MSKRTNQRTFVIRAIWDEEAGVFYSESDIRGLHIEAETLDEFQDVMREAAVELIIANHITESDIAKTPIADLIPAIVWQPPGPAAAVA